MLYNKPVQIINTTSILLQIPSQYTLGFIDIAKVTYHITQTSE